jgi:hypothetical protein
VKKSCLAAAALVCCVRAGAASAPSERAEFSRLYDCARALHRAGRSPDLGFLENDLFYVLDARTPELYLFTPDFAGKSDLARNIRSEVEKVLDANKLGSDPFPFTPCCQQGFS